VQADGVYQGSSSRGTLRAPMWSLMRVVTLSGRPPVACRTSGMGWDRDPDISGEASPTLGPPADASGRAGGGGWGEGGAWREGEGEGGGRERERKGEGVWRWMRGGG